MMMQVGKGLKAVAKQAFDAKVARLARPQLKTATYNLVNGKVEGVPVGVLVDAVLAAGNTFNQTANKFYVAKRTR